MELYTIGVGPLTLRDTHNVVHNILVFHICQEWLVSMLYLQQRLDVYSRQCCLVGDAVATLPARKSLMKDIVICGQRKGRWKSVRQDWAGMGMGWGT